jgi:hypothetical protein
MGARFGDPRGVAELGFSEANGLGYRGLSAGMVQRDLADNVAPKDRAYRSDGNLYCARV